MGRRAGGGYTRVREVRIGDIGFADDTNLLGKDSEMFEAEEHIIRTLTDWEEKVNSRNRET